MSTETTTPERGLLHHVVRHRNIVMQDAELGLTLAAYILAASIMDWQDVNTWYGEETEACYDCLMKEIYDSMEEVAIKTADIDVENTFSLMKESVEDEWDLKDHGFVTIGPQNMARLASLIHCAMTSCEPLWSIMQLLKHDRLPSRSDMAIRMNERVWEYKVLEAASELTEAQVLNLGRRYLRK